MPSYRLVKPLPEVLNYKDGTQLVLYGGDRMSSGYVVSYRKTSGAWAEAILFTGGSAEEAERRMRESFYVSDDTPEDRVMKSLMARGYAVCVGMR